LSDILWTALSSQGYANGGYPPLADVAVGAEIKNFDEAPFARISGTFERSSATAIDPKRHFAAAQQFGCYRSEADMNRQAKPT